MQWDPSRCIENADKINIIKLRSTSNEMKLGMIKAILGDNEIPYIVKNHGLGDI